jgi:hypothetical protein
MHKASHEGKPNEGRTEMERLGVKNKLGWRMHR